MTINKRLVTSGLTIAAAAALLIGATFAFFTDSETSTGNTFSAGGLDLKVDSEAHYAGLVCNSSSQWQFEATSSSRPDLVGDPCDGTWAQTDLGPTHKFFNLSDLKPGDSGENTISLHVINNDAWGRLVINSVQDLENTYLQEELEAGDPDGVASGELRENLLFSIWLDEGTNNGFQCSGLGAECGADPQEGDNIKQAEEPELVSQGTLDAGSETHNIWQGLAAVFALQGARPGIVSDGRMVGSTTYYFGIDWELPEGVGNVIETDSLVANMSFQVVQHRNNPSKLGF